MLFAKAAVKNQHAKDALDVFEEAELVESCRPLMEALRALVAGTADYLMNLAPEIRNSAEKLYKELPDGDE